MSKTHYELRINKRVLRINRKEYDALIPGMFRLFFSFCSIGCVTGVAMFAARIESGYYPVPFGDTTVTVGDALWCMVILALALPVCLYMVASFCEWPKKKVKK